MNAVPSSDDLPILYSFRRCPYAMRARLAIVAAGIRVELREIELRNKPAQMLAVSPKGTVPVLVLTDGEVIDESLDIMHWAVSQSDKQQWLTSGYDADAQNLIDHNDGEFKYFLDRYKYADRYPEQPVEYYRTQAERFLHELENRLQQNNYLAGIEFGFVDAAIAPFVRQFAAVDKAWFSLTPYPALRQWLQAFLDSPLFTAVMQPYSPWSTIADKPVHFPC